ncbi:hypothetical protein BSKO_01663 [Bryopsis sp. KO-2023]|nr:hypothetical protein BSKO_01663 [Bryopsis sp. KO-2023]
MNAPVIGEDGGEGTSASVPVAGGTLPLQIPPYPPSLPGFPSGQVPSALPGFQFAQQPQPQMGQLLNFWQSQLEEIQNLGPEDWKLHQLPLARIKKIMKSDEDVRMISAEAPVLFSKACEMFILELTLRAWFQSEANKRRTLQRSDIAAAITSTDVFDFLVDIVPRDGGREELDAGRLTVPHPLAGMYPYFPPTGAYRPVGVPGREGNMQGAAGFPVPLDPQLYQWQWAQQATQSGAQGQSALLLPQTRGEDPNNK